MPETAPHAPAGTGPTGPAGTGPAGPAGKRPGADRPRGAAVRQP